MNGPFSVQWKWGTSCMLTICTSMCWKNFQLPYFQFLSFQRIPIEDFFFWKGSLFWQWFSCFSLYYLYVMEPLMLLLLLLMGIHFFFFGEEERVLVGQQSVEKGSDQSWGWPHNHLSSAAHRAEAEAERRFLHQKSRLCIYIRLNNMIFSFLVAWGL